MKQRGRRPAIRPLSLSVIPRLPPRFRSYFKLTESARFSCCSNQTGLARFLSESPSGARPIASLHRSSSSASRASTTFSSLLASSPFHSSPSSLQQIEDVVRDPISPPKTTASAPAPASRTRSAPSPPTSPPPLPPRALPPHPDPPLPRLPSSASMSSSSTTSPTPSSSRGSSPASGTSAGSCSSPPPTARPTRSTKTGSSASCSCPLSPCSNSAAWSTTCVLRWTTASWRTRTEGCGLRGRTGPIPTRSWRRGSGRWSRRPGATSTRRRMGVRRVRGVVLLLLLLPETPPGRQQQHQHQHQHQQTHHRPLAPSL